MAAVVVLASVVGSVALVVVGSGVGSAALAMVAASVGRATAMVAGMVQGTEEAAAARSCDSSTRAVPVTVYARQASASVHTIPAAGSGSEGCSTLQAYHLCTISNCCKSHCAYI